MNSVGAFPPGRYSTVSTYTFNACAIRADGTPACWGTNYNGESTPPAGTFVQITSGSNSSCARNIDNVVACWGTKNAFGDLHNRLARSVHAGQGYHACVIELDGTLTCVGVNNEDLGRPPAGRFVQVDVGVLHACALRADHSIACWGRNTYGESTPPAR